MKTPAVLLFISICLAFGAGYLALQLRKSDRPPFQFSMTEINRLKRQFREKTQVVAELNAVELFPDHAGLELLDPENILVATKGRRFRQVASIQNEIRFCAPALVKDRDLAKARLWIAYACGQVSRLPDDFFERPPFLFPLGSSFAALAAFSNRAEFRSVEWISEHAHLFHAVELKNLPPAVNADARRRILARVSLQTLERLVAGQSWILDEDEIFVRKSPQAGGESPLASPAFVDYLIYDRGDWEGFLKSRHVATVAMADGGTRCLFHDDGLCWIQSPTPSVRQIRWSAGLLLTLALALTGFFAVQIILTIQAQKLEGDRKRFALRSLTHELRTPLASLVISSEQLRREFGQWPAHSQETFLRMFDDVQRLKRVAESSRHYLSAPQSKSVVPLEMETVSSVNDYVESALERQRDEMPITLQKLEVDGPFSVDRYWLGVCLQNLVQNACQHGRQPIGVRLKRSGTALVVSVTDAGDLKSTDRKNLFVPFKKREGSSGLGLGLVIVDTVTKAMNSNSRSRSHQRPSNSGWRPGDEINRSSHRGRPQHFGFFVGLLDQ